jgi:hypothetical protein
MNRQERVLKALTDGFENNDVASSIDPDGVMTIVVSGIDGYFEVTPVGDVATFPYGLSAELQYWVSVDLACLDLLALNALEP